MDNLYANVPRDLTKVKSKILFNLTKRQVLCFGAALLAGLPLYFLLRKIGNTTLASMSMILVMLPFFFFAMFQRNGQPLEVILKHFFRARLQRPRIRVYRTENQYRRAVPRHMYTYRNRQSGRKRKQNDHHRNKEIREGGEKKDA